MPRVTTKTRNRGGKKVYRCTKCRDEIVAGQEYREWSFRYGGTYRMHAKCGFPRPSQLTGSDKLQRLYEAREALEDFDMAVYLEASGDAISDVRDLDVITDATATAEEIAQEYADAFEAFPNPEFEEKADACSNWQSDLENFSVTDFEAPEPEGRFIASDALQYQVPEFDPETEGWILHAPSGYWFPTQDELDAYEAETFGQALDAWCDEVTEAVHDLGSGLEL